MDLDSDSDLWASMSLPMAFGKSKPKKGRSDALSRFDKTKRVEEVQSQPTIDNGKGKGRAEEDDDDMGPQPLGGPSASPSPGPQPAPRQNELEYDDDEDDDMSDTSDSESSPLFPITNEITLKDHTKVVSALALDPSGARIASGSHDYDCKLWDFGGMAGGLRPFRTFEPAGSYHVHDIKYSNSGDSFLVISGTSQAKLYDRDGEEKQIYIKGDPYIRDMRHTAGHVGELTSCAWHPKEANTFMTSSNDSTIRIWDVENKRKQKTVIVLKSKERGARTKVTACAYSSDGKTIAGACLDGTLNLWSTSSNFVRPSQTAENAHTKGTEIGSVTFSIDGQTLLSRGADGTVKLWDVRSFRKPLHSSAIPLPSLYPETNAVFSPDGRHVVTGTSATSKDDRGKLVFLSKEGLQVEKSLDCAPGVGVVRVVWHPKINQIITGLSNGAIQVLYSPHTSINGAKLLNPNKAPKKATIEDATRAMLPPTILTPHALPMFRDDAERSNKRKRDKDRFDPRKTRRPEAPVSGPGRGGRVGASATQHVVQSLVRDTTRDEDPREALLKYAELAEKDPQWTVAWKENQPKPVFQEEEREEENEE